MNAEKDKGMASIPVAWLLSIFALLLVAIVARQVRMPVFARTSFGVALISIAIVAVFVGVRFQFSDPVFIVLQPYLAAVTAPAFWLGFHALTTQNGVPNSGAVRVAASIVALAWIIIAVPYPWTASVAVILVNTIYAVRLLGLLRLPSERFVHIAPQADPALRTALGGCLAFITLVVIIDASVLITGMAAGEARAMALLSDAAFLAVATISLGVVTGLALVIGSDRQTEDEAQSIARPLDEDRAIFEKLDVLMAEANLFQDPEITVARLGRRLGVPARSVSSAVNRVTGENTSRYINGLRVQHAVHLLESTTLPVTDVMLESGFISKSSFNTEFRRITGQTPSGHRKSHRPDAPMVRKQASERSTS
ncbi:helix-turn-helix domain-containing protein [Tropicimonas sp. TH_r6]|uniref:helix-turn-helix domain-containing protein n=1 Tax=Tropicimonas sp. TH_r6 TaxID=3082085 RepID=UPI002953C102|nr:helix-turn-helix domain-containing protein [Tropicimonas sp. TH_r6]MDV7144858.1 helix-turn-helix domain-containing protein [Tropicimonas sp. TH_r6]